MSDPDALIERKGIYLEKITQTTYSFQWNITLQVNVLQSVPQMVMEMVPEMVPEMVRMV